MYDIIIVGFGISALCFLTYLLKNNLIEKYNILVIEKYNTPCKYSLNYKNINSNSTLDSLISIFRNSIFDNIINNLKNLNTFVNLHDYNKIISDICDILLKKLESFENVKILFNTEVNNIIYLNKTIKVDNYTTKTCIISMGAKQDLEFIRHKDIDKILPINQDKIILPEKIFNNSYDINKLINKNIAIIGSSHSSISIIDCLISKKINYKNITLLCRNDFKVFFKDLEDSKKNGYNYKNDDVCSETQMVNRFDGLRENSKNIYMNLDKYNIKKILNKKIACDNYDIIIPCWGYYKKIPKINNILYTQNINSNEEFELKIQNKVYKNIFIIGISSDPKIKITQKSFKKSIDGVWIYYNIISKKLCDIIDSKINVF